MRRFLWLLYSALEANFFLWFFVLLANHRPQSPKRRETKTGLEANSAPFKILEVLASINLQYRLGG